MGWNQVEQASPSVVDGIGNHARFYFVHSYRAAPRLVNEHR